MQLVAWCYPRLTGPVLNKHRYCVRVAAARVAVRTGRTYPGGFIWRSKASMLLPEMAKERKD